MFRDKEVVVKLSEEADKVYQELNRIEIITFIMDIFDHKNYDKVFGYKHF